MTARGALCRERRNVASSLHKVERVREILGERINFTMDARRIVVICVGIFSRLTGGRPRETHARPTVSSSGHPDILGYMLSPLASDLLLAPAVLAARSPDLSGRRLSGATRTEQVEDSGNAWGGMPRVERPRCDDRINRLSESAVRTGPFMITVRSTAEPSEADPMSPVRGNQRSVREAPALSTERRSGAGGRRSLVPRTP
jgi:hypothetical protein